ncbi:hypothetical protein GCM10022224_043490 [Nonomuraea antimicrobica]|uniref:Uncharacterized protein n=1 Tax=Nonomuraea antimicrobica TaxID=561173 RepID=A0ABP7C2M6_9ACTN
MEPLHRIRDVIYRERIRDLAYREDACKVRTGAASRTPAMVGPLTPTGSSSWPPRVSCAVRSPTGRPFRLHPTAPSGHAPFTRPAGLAIATSPADTAATPEPSNAPDEAAAGNAAPPARAPGAQDRPPSRSCRGNLEPEHDH